MKFIISKLDIVTPKVYNSLFLDLAKKYDCKCDENSESEKVEEYILKNLEQVTKLNQETENKIIQLDKTTGKAMEAIKSSNKALLEESLSETSKLKQEIEKLKEVVYRDELTKSYNRKWFNDNYIGSDGKFLKNGYLAIIDLNDFKAINDKYGHIVGDKILTYLSSILEKYGDYVVRYGGDEFFILFDEQKSDKDVEQSLKDAKDELRVKNLKFREHIFSISFSVGYSSFKVCDNVSQIIDIADDKMYLDKKAYKSSKV